RDRHEVAQKIEPGVGVDQRGIGEAGIADQHGVAVSRRTGDDRRTDGAAGTAAIVDRDRLAKPLADIFCEGAGEGVGRAAGGKWHDPGDLLLRPLLGPCARRYERSSEADERRTPVHAGFLVRCQITISTMMPAIASPADEIAMAIP